MLRFLRYAFTGFFGVLALAMFAIGVAHGQIQTIFPALPMVVVAALGWFGFGLQLKRIEQQGDLVRASIEEIATKLFDAPATVHPGYDMTVTSGATGEALNALDSDAGYTAEGIFGGARVGVASHASTLGRQVGELTHTYSYVVVDVNGLTVPFKLAKEGVVDSVLKLATGDVEVGDPEFDEEWTIEADAELARAVLDDSVRERLTALRARVPSVSVDVGPGTMSVILTRHGLAIRWPGPIDVELATFMRDLLVDMRRAMIAHVDRQALRAAATAGGPHYRVAADPDAPAPAAEPAVLEDEPTEEPTARRAARE